VAIQREPRQIVIVLPHSLVRGGRDPTIIASIIYCYFVIIMAKVSPSQPGWQGESPGCHLPGGVFEAVR
jgi:hypothetical protein